MAGPTLSRFLGYIRLRDASDPTRVASVGADGKVATSDATLATRIGEVQASPSANTVLGRLKDAVTQLTSAVTALVAIQAAVESPDSASVVALGDAAGSGTPHYRKSVGTGSDATTVKASPGQIYSGHVSNAHASDGAWIKFANKTSNPTVAGGETVAYAIYVPPKSTVPIVAPIGKPFTTGIAYWLTTVSADTGTQTAVGASDVAVSLVFV